MRIKAELPIGYKIHPIKGQTSIKVVEPNYLKNIFATIDSYIDLTPKEASKIKYYYDLRSR